MDYITSHPLLMFVLTCFQVGSPFLLPAGNLFTATTTINTTVRYGRRYQLLVQYVAEPVVRKQLEEYGWEAAAAAQRAGTLNEKARQTYRYMKVGISLGPNV